MNNGATLRMWQGIKERCFDEGATAPAGAPCPYKRSSFGWLHWQRGNKARKDHPHGKEC